VKKVEIFFAGPISADRLHVEWRDPQAISDCARARIDHQWNIYMEEARRKGVSLFNGPAVALHDYRAHEGGLAIKLSAGDYKSFITTCVRDHDWFAKNAPEALSRALGNSALLTHKDNAYLGVRSKTAAIYPRLAHVFGGVPEYEGNEKKTMATADIMNHLSRELAEEAGLSSSDFASPPVLLGLFYETNLRQPELVWQWELKSPLNNAAADEHDGIRVVSRSVKDAVGLTPLASAAIERWQTS
jgi:hypothetical protein